MPPKNHSAGRRRRRFSTDCASSIGVIPRGPESLEELQGWPLDIVAGLLTPCWPGDEERRCNLAALMGHWQWVFTGDYSGTECCREVTRLHLFPTDIWWTEIVLLKRFVFFNNFLVFSA